MPPKPKYTKDQIVAIALDVVSQQGLQALTAKELGAALGTSTSPIFTVFDSMQQVQDAVKAAAMARFESYAHKTGKDMPPFKQIGMQMILFAKKEPRLYQLLFMSPSCSVESFEDIFERLGAVAEESLQVIQNDYGLTRDSTKNLFKHTWIHTFGIGALCATGMCNFSEEMISQMLTQDFTAMLTMLKSNSSPQTKKVEGGKQ